MTDIAYPTEDEIHAYVDGALDPVRYEQVAAILREDASLAARVAGYCNDRDGLRQALAGVATRSLPPQWQARIEASMHPRRTLQRRQAIAAGLAIVLASGAGTALFWPRKETILEAALAARDNGLGGTRLDSAGGASGSNTSLAAALGLNVRPPDLHRFGFHLAKLEVSGARTAQMEYRDPPGRRLTIYVRPSDGTVRFDLLRRGAARVCVWQDDVVGAVIVAPMSAGEMLRVASAAYAALNL